MMKYEHIMIHINLRKKIQKSGLSQINTKNILAFLLLLIMTCSVGVEQSTALISDRYALEENNTLEGAIAKNYYETILTKFLEHPNGTCYFEGGTLTQI